MSWIMFDNMLLNLDHVISIDRVGNRSLDVYIAGSPNLESKRVEYDTKEKRDKAYDIIGAFVTRENPNA